MPNEILILILAAAALLVSVYITYKKGRKEKLVCKIGQDCNVVLNSKYNKLFFGIPNEVAGIVYFTALLLASIVFLFSPSLLTPQIELVRQIVTGISALASLGFIYIQVAILKELCEYCMIVNIINIVIFVLIMI